MFAPVAEAYVTRMTMSSFAVPTDGLIIEHRHGRWVPSSSTNLEQSRTAPMEATVSAVLLAKSDCKPADLQ